MAGLMHLSPMLIGNIISYLEGVEVNQFLSLSKDFCSLLQHIELQQFLLLKVLHNHFRRHFGEFNSLEIDNPASTLYHRMNPQTWADEDEDVTSKMIKDTGFKIKRMKNHVLNVCMRHFPKTSMGTEAGSAHLLPNYYPHTTAPPPTRPASLTETPFTVVTMKKNGLYNARLSCISYFEVQFISKSADMMVGNKHKNDKFCFGVTTHQELQKNHESANQFSFVYNHNGKIMHSRSTFANDCYYRFNGTDVVGCGIVYPPLAENFGQVFFTRNGEVVHSELFTKKEYLSNSWFPFAMNANSYEAKFNFGIKRPWSFNIIAYESSKLASTSFLSYDQFLLNRPAAIDNRNMIDWQHDQKHKVHRIQEDEDGYDNSAPIQEIIVAHLMDADNSGSASNECSTSESEDSGSEKKGGYHHHRSNNRHRQSRDNDNDNDNVHHNSSSMLPPAPHGFRTSPKSSIKKTPQQHGKNNNQVNFSSSNVQYELERSDSRGSRNQTEYGPYYDDHDGEDSMAVELSSVDSVAVNDLRDCGISIGGDADSAMAINGNDSVSVMSTFTTPALTQGTQQHQHQSSHHQSNQQHQHQQQMQLDNEMNGIGMEYNYALSASAAGVMDTTNTNNAHGHYNTLADGNGALNWLQTASEANIQSRSFFARSTDDGDSERSIATSLFVEVASVDDDGSYTGYGGRGYEDEDLDGEVDFIRGKLATSVDTQLQYESDDSGARWFDGNSISSRKSKSTTKRRMGSSADSQGSSTGRHYNKKRRTGYSSYAQHETLALDQQQQQQLAQERMMRQDSPQANAMLVDEEDGYDGEEDGMDDMSTTDIQLPAAVHNHSSSSSSLPTLMPSSLQPFTAVAETIQHHTIMRRANTPSSGCSGSSTAGDGTQDLSPSGSENNSVGMILPAVRTSYGSGASSSGNNNIVRPSRLRRRKASLK